MKGKNYKKSKYFQKTKIDENRFNILKYPLRMKFLCKNSAVCVRTRTVNVNTFSTTVKDEISERW